MNRLVSSWAVAVLVGVAGVTAASPTLRRVVSPDVPVDNIDTFASVRAALTTPGLASGAYVYVEPDANPGPLSNTDMTIAQAAAAQDVKVVGPREVDPATQQPLLILNSVNISNSGYGFYWLNIRMVNDARFNVTGDGFTLGQSVISSDEAQSGGLVQVGGANTYFPLNRFASSSGAQIKIMGTSSHTVIHDNEFVSHGSVNPILYETATSDKNDLIYSNLFVGARGLTTGHQIFIPAGISNVVIEDNLFQDEDTAASAVLMANGSAFITVRGNRIQFKGDAPNGAIIVSGGVNGALTAFNFSGNDISLNLSSVGISVTSALSGTLLGTIEGNRIRSIMGVRLTSGGVPVTGIDMGGGIDGSLGANNFRAFNWTVATAGEGAIVTGAGAGSVTAEKNLFGTANPESSIYDNNDDNARVDISAANPPTGNRAYVASLYGRFVHRAANFSDPTIGAGLYLAQLDSGKKPAVVAKAVVRSFPALYFVVDDVYHQVLRRGVYSTEFVTEIQNLTRRREEDLYLKLFTSAEGRSIYGSDHAFTHKVYTTFLGRLPSETEAIAFKKLAVRSRKVAVMSILKTPEYTTRRVTAAFEDLLRRAPTADEIKKYKAFDRLRLLTTIAALPEYYTGG